MRKKVLFNLTIAIIVVFGLWFLYQKSLKMAQYLSPKTQQFLSQAHFKFQALTANLVDAFYLQIYFASTAQKKLPQLDLIMSSTDIDNLTADAQKSLDLGYSDKETAKTQQISLFYEKKSYPIKISFHGGGANDFVFNKLDYNLKLSGKQTIKEYDSFTLFNPAIHKWLVPLLANQVAADLNLYYNQQFPVLVKINRKTSGVYLFEEKINADFLKKRDLQGAQIIKLRDETRLPHRINPVALNAHHLSGWDFEIANVNPLDKNSPQILFNLNQFFKAIKEKDVNQISEFIDFDYWARYDAYREFLAISHNTAGDNLIMYYSMKEKKFYPIVRSEGDLGQLVLNGGTTLKSYNSYDPHLIEQYDYPQIFLLLHRNPQFRILKYKYLYQLISEYPQLQQNFKAIYDKYSKVFLYDTSDEASVFTKKKLFKNYLSMINNNYSLIKQELEFAQVAINIINTPGQAQIEIVPDAVVPIKFDQLDLEFSDKTTKTIMDLVNQKIILADFSADFDLIPTTFVFTFSVKAPVVAVKTKAQNLITGLPITGIYTAVASDNSPSD